MVSQVNIFFHIFPKVFLQEMGNPLIRSIRGGMEMNFQSVAYRNTGLTAPSNFS
jgi:hypothetical protein